MQFSDSKLRRAGPPSNMLIPDELVWEVLRWLPVKSLMRFKCVSRTWLSVIKDLPFAKAYCGGSRGLLSGQPTRFQPCNRRCLFYIGLDGCHGTTSQILPYYVLEHENMDQMIRYTDVVDGLLCFYQGQHSWLCNVATREMMQLPSSTDLEEAPEESNILYHFGFDPINKSYKLLKTSAGCIEILTIGVDTYWRTVYSRLFVEIASQSACIGGLLCWIENFDPVVVAFHLAEEKFMQIPTPFEPAEVDYGVGSIPSLKLLRFGPRLIVTKEIDDEQASVKILRYCHADGNEDIDYKTVGSWVDELSQLRCMDVVGSTWNTLQNPTVVGIFPDGKMLMYDQITSLPANLYILDPLKKDKLQIQVDACQELLGKYGCDCPIELFDNCSYLEENIFPLSHLISSV